MAPIGLVFRSKALVVTLAVLVLASFFIWAPLPHTENRDAFLEKITDVINVGSSAPLGWHPPELSKVKAKNAFATFLVGKDGLNDDNWDDDNYFHATRILAYQLLHAKETRSSDTTIPFIVLVTEKVSERQRERLRKDGCLVVEADYLRSDWVKTDVSTWAEVTTKFRLWDLTQFDRIAFLDGDTVLMQPLDGVFDDPAVKIQTTSTQPAAIKDDEAQMPESYSFAGVPEMNRQHGYPPINENGDFPNFNYLNAGFFVFKPSREMLNYYLSIMELPGRFDPKFPEQNLMNYAHRRDGNMPWTKLGNTWNIHYPVLSDVEGGVKSLHDKWWSPENKDLKPLMDSWRWRMEGFFGEQDTTS